MKCARLRAKGIPQSEIYVHGVKRRKYTLAKRQARVKEKMDAANDEFPLRFATNDVKRARMQAIRRRMGLTWYEFGRLLKLSHYQIRHILLNESFCQLAYVELAEEKLSKFLAVERRKNRKLPKVHISPKICDDVRLKAKILTAYAVGMPPNKIASEFAVSPETVKFFLSRAEDKE